MKWHPPRYFVAISTVGTFVGGAILFKEVLGGEAYEGKEDLTEKVAIVTGSNTGIGKATALELAKRNARVIMACRDLDKCKAARKEIVFQSRNKQVVCRSCDLASQKSIRAFTAGILASEKRLDILINNAAVMRCPQSVTEDGIELQLGTNHMGHFLLTVLLLPLIKASSPSRIITVSSVAHMHGKINFEDFNSDKAYDPAQAYEQSKLANILFTRELAKRLEGTQVTCNAVHPGLVNTELTRHMGISKSWFAYVFVNPLMWLFLKTPRQGAKGVVYAALSSDLDGVSGKYFSNQKECEVSIAAKDDVAARRLWMISEKWTHLT